jgi:hypothetical protein
MRDYLPPERPDIDDGDPGPEIEDPDPEGTEYED